MDKPDKKTEQKEFLKFIFVSVLIITIIRTFIMQPFIVSGISMFPTLHNKDYLIIEELTYRFREPKRGDIIVFKKPDNSGKFLVKRIIGLPGETIRIENNKVTIFSEEYPDGLELDESYLLNNISFDVSVSLGPDEYFVMGDNRIASSDSRYWGPISKEDIVGKVFLRLFPLKQAALKPGDHPEVYQQHIDKKQEPES